MLLPIGKIYKERLNIQQKPSHHQPSSAHFLFHKEHHFQASIARYHHITSSKMAISNILKMTATTLFLVLGAQNTLAAPLVDTSAKVLAPRQGTTLRVEYCTEINCQ